MIQGMYDADADESIGISSMTDDTLLQYCDVFLA